MRIQGSLVLATWARDYIGGLTASRYRGRADPREAHQGINLWTARFAGACSRAVSDASSFERRAQEIETEWRQRLGRVRAQSATDLLLRSLIGVPVITTNSAAELIGRSYPQTNEAIERLLEAKILRPVNVGKRNRAFEAPAITEAFTMPSTPAVDRYAFTGPGRGEWSQVSMSGGASWAARAW